MAEKATIVSAHPLAMLYWEACLMSASMADMEALVPLELNVPHSRLEFASARFKRPMPESLSESVVRSLTMRIAKARTILLLAAERDILIWREVNLQDMKMWIVGARPAVESAVINIASGGLDNQLLSMFDRFTGTEHPIEYVHFPTSTVKAFLPIPPPLKGWSGFRGWLLMGLPPDTPIEDKDGATLKDAMMAWLNHSQAFLDEVHQVFNEDTGRSEPDTSQTNRDFLLSRIPYLFESQGSLPKQVQVSTEKG